MAAARSGRGVRWWWALALSACVHELARRDAGDACVFNGDCKDPLVCAARVCRAPCRDDRDCSNAWRCLPGVSAQCNEPPCAPPRQRVCVEPGGPAVCFDDRDCVDADAVCDADQQCRYRCTVGFDYDCEVRFGRGARCASRPTGGAVCEAPARADAGVDASVDVPDASVDAAVDVVAVDARDAWVDAPDARDAARDVATDGNVFGARCALVRADGVCVPGEPGCALRKIVRSSTHDCALFEDGSLRCWGNHSMGALGPLAMRGNCDVPGIAYAEPSDDVAVGRDFTCALRRDHTVRCWGRNDNGQCGSGAVTPSPQLAPSPVLRVGGDVLADARAVFAGESGACAIVGAEGRLLCWGTNAGSTGGPATSGRPAAAEVTGLADVVGVSIGSAVSCAWQSDGASWCWGTGPGVADGATTGARPTPQRARFGLVRAVTVSEFATCALLRDDTVQCAGADVLGALGLGETDAGARSGSTPRAVPGLTDVVELTAGGGATCARVRSSAVLCWGYIPRGLAGSGARETWTSPTAVPHLPASRQIVAGGSTVSDVLGLCAWVDGVDVRCVGSRPGDGASASDFPVRINWLAGGL